jgi:SAM-dependent methyltransferase
MRLICGAGKNYKKERQNDVTLDIRKFEGIDVVADLNEPWPFDECEFTHVSALHVVEHLDSLLHFMDEAWRVLTKGGSLYIETPLAGGDADLEFSDPTHVRCYTVHTWINYFTPEGVHNFYYTDKEWAILFQKVEKSIIKIHLTPIK